MNIQLPNKNFQRKVIGKIVEFLIMILLVIIILGLTGLLKKINKNEIEILDQDVVADTLNSNLTRNDKQSKNNPLNTSHSKPTVSKNYTPQEYINRFYKTAQQEMKLYGIPASITLGQACLESGYGNNWLAKNTNNHFGVKCFNTNCSETHCVNRTDDSIHDRFRVYKTAWFSFRDHTKVLHRPKYKELYYLPINDYKKWAKTIKKCGYATDPNYDKKLIKIIDKYQLYKFDEIDQYNDRKISYLKR